MIAGAVHHPNVVDVYEVVTVEAPEDPGGRRYAIVMELIEGLTLDQTIVRNGPLPARQVAQLGITLAGALEYLAGKGLARLDLKPHNIVLSPARGPVIIDLGIAKIVENAQAWLVDSDGPSEPADPPTQLGIVIGTPAYLSPEQARGEEVDARSDVYALGLVLCTCLAGRHPYQELDPVAVMARATIGGLETSGLPCSPELRAVLARATQREPAERYDPAGLLAALRGIPEARGQVTASP
jgi:serine/threonine-protein kinase